MDGQLDWYVFANDPNSAYEIPGAILSSGQGSAVKRTFTGRSRSVYDEVEWTFNFGAELEFSANTKYWIGLHLSADFDSDHLYWEDNGDPRLGNHVYGYGVRSQSGTMNNWTANGSYDVAFELYSLPFSVPDAGSTFVQLSVGLLFLFFARQFSVQSRVAAAPRLPCWRVGPENQFCCFRAPDTLSL